MGIETTPMQTGEEFTAKISPEEFEEQFVKQTAEVEGHSFEFVKVEPEEGETISDQWVVFLGGFGAGAEEYRAEIEDLARSGRKVFFMNPLKGMEMSEADSQTLAEFDVPETIKNKTAEILKALEFAGIERADFIGHSQGAILSSLIASLRPGMAEDLVLNNPGGMHGEDSWLGMVSRTGKGFVEQQVVNHERKQVDPDEKARVKSTFKSVLKGSEMYKNPIYRQVKEIPGIYKSNIIPLLEALKAKQEGLDEDERTKTTLVTANKDRTFSPERIEDEIGFDTESQEAMEKALETVVDSYVMYIDKDAGHEASIYEKSGLTAQVVNEKFMKEGQISTQQNISQ